MNTDDPPHLTAEDVAAFVDGRMTPAARADAEAHLADCRACRNEIAAVRRLVIARSPGRPTVLLPVGLAAAAVIAFVALSLSRPGAESSADRVRTPAVTNLAGDSQRIAVIAPTEGDTIQLAKSSLLWSAVTGEPTYRLTLTDASGQLVWTTTTTDTALTLPAQVVLQPRTKYFWYVDALRADGRAASTGVRSFTTP